MRLLLDECVPRPLKRDLPGHDVHTVVEMGWSSKRNGELLRLMLAERFEAFLTVDQNIEFQQNVKASGVAVIVVVARTNRLRELRPLAPKILDALKRVKAGDYESRCILHRLNGRDEQRRSKLRHLCPKLCPRRTGDSQFQPTGHKIRATDRSAYLIDSK